MIPKVIHYCWFGGKPLPPMALKCIESWKKYFPDYEIKRWDESNFDVNVIPYTQQAYEAKRYAFVSDYARLWILYNYGGIYFDTDVEVIKSFDKIFEQGPFMGCENPPVPGASPEELGVNPGLGIGTPAAHPFYKRLLEYYEHLPFYQGDSKQLSGTIVSITTSLLIKEGLKNTSDIQRIAGIEIYPQDYFCPFDIVSNKLTITPNTVSIHNYAGSWCSPRELLYIRLQRIVGRKGMQILIKLKTYIKNAFSFLTK